MEGTAQPDASLITPIRARLARAQPLAEPLRSRYRPYPSSLSSSRTLRSTGVCARLCGVSAGPKKAVGREGRAAGVRDGLAAPRRAGLAVERERAAWRMRTCGGGSREAGGGGGGR